MGQNKLEVAITGDSAQLAQSVKKAEGSIRKFSAASQNYVASLQGAVTSLVAAFGGLQLGAFFKDSIMLAANIEQANVALGSIATSLGKSSAEAIKYRDSLRDINITTSAATNATAQFLRAGLPLDGLNQLGQAAQGAAISYNMLGKETISSSEALDKMTRAIVTGNVIELKTLGFQTMLLDLLRENKLATGEASTEVDSHARRLLVLNDVLKQSGSLMNLYSDSTGLASKNISSSKRPLEEMRLALGNLFLPELTSATAAWYQTLKDGQQWVKDNQQAMDELKDSIEGVSKFLETMSKLEFASIKELVSFLAFLGDETNSFYKIDGLAGILNGLDVTIQMMGNSLAYLAAIAVKAGSAFMNIGKGNLAAAEADAEEIKRLFARLGEDTDKLLLRKNPYKKTPEDKAREEAQAEIDAEAEGFYQEMARLKGEANQQPGGDDGVAAKAAKESSAAWKKVYADLKFEAAGFYDDQIKLINQQADEYHKAGVSAVVVEQWKNSQLKKLNKEAAQASEDLFKEEQDRALKEVEWEQKLREDAAKEADKNTKESYDQQQKYLDEWFKETADKTTEMSEVWKSAFHNMESFAGSTFFDLMKGNFDNIGEAFSDMVLRMIAEWQAAQFTMAMVGDATKDGKLGGLLGAAATSLGWLIKGTATSTGTYGVLPSDINYKPVWSSSIPGVQGSFAVGTDYVPYDMIAQIHKGEAIIPAAYNKPGMDGGTTNVTIINNTNATAKTTEARNASGGKDITVMIDEAVGNAIMSGRGATSRAMRQMFGATPVMGGR